MTGEVTGYLLDNSGAYSDSPYSSSQVDTRIHSVSSQAPVTGSVSLKAIVIDNEGIKDLSNIYSCLQWFYLLFGL